MPAEEEAFRMSRARRTTSRRRFLEAFSTLAAGTAAAVPLRAATPEKTQNSVGKSHADYLAVGVEQIANASMECEPWQRMLSSRKMVNDYLVRIARQVTDQAASEISSQLSWERVRERRRVELLEMLGLYPLPDRRPLNVRIAGVVDKGNYRIEKIAFESLPRIYVTSNLYIPKMGSWPLPAVIYVCGHVRSPQGSKVMWQRHPITFAKHGYVCIIIDPIQIAETFALHHGVSFQEMYDWYARGYTPAGVEVWNVMQALNYLETRSEVDKNRIGVTGMSGGAAMSWFSGAVDPRLKVIVPVMGNSTLAATVAANSQKLHCDCIFAVNTFMHDFMIQGALIAPRPLCMMHGKRDALFPVPGWEEFELKVGNLYRAYGAAEKFKNFVVDTAHEDSDLLREEAVHWFDRYLKEIPARKIDLSYQNEKPELLAVFGATPPANAQNFRVHEMLTAAPKPQNYKTIEDWKIRRSELIALLREKVFHTHPQARPDLQIQQIQQIQNAELGMAQGFQELHLTSEEGITLRCFYQGLAAEPGTNSPALIYIASDGEDLEAIARMLFQVLEYKKPVIIVYTRGVGEVPWVRTVWRDILRNSMLVGRTVDSARVWDVLQTVEFLRRQSGVDISRITVLGRGVSGTLGLYAAILDEAIHQVILMAPPTSHIQGPIFLNVLRYTDLPESAALLAPRRLVFYGWMPEAYQYTRAIYRLYGRPRNMSVSMSINAALDGRYDHNFTAEY